MIFGSTTALQVSGCGSAAARLSDRMASTALWELQPLQISQGADIVQLPGLIARAISCSSAAWAMMQMEMKGFWMTSGASTQQLTNGLGWPEAAPFNPSVAHILSMAPWGLQPQQTPLVAAIQP